MSLRFIEEETNHEVTDEANTASSSNIIQKRKRKLSFFYLLIGFLFMFCFMTIIFWYVDVKFFNGPMNVYVLTEKITSVEPSTVSEKSSTTIFTTEQPSCSRISDLEKVDCYPEAIPSEIQCTIRGCCYQSVNAHLGMDSKLPHPGVPTCYYSPDYIGYSVTTVTHTEDGLTATLERNTASGFADDIRKLNLVVSHIDRASMRIKITDANNYRYEAPLFKEIKLKEIKNDDRLYDIDLSSDGMLSVARRSSGNVIFNTDLSLMIYSNQFLQITSKLPSVNIYGLGEHYTSMLKDVNWTRLTFFNKDNFPGPDLNIYGTHPFYLSLENKENSHGVLLLNSNSMDVILQPLPAITYRTIGGIFDFYFFFGPSPSEVVQQYTDLIGRSLMPPYWSLGFHLCKYGYNNMQGVREVYQRTRNAGVPYDVQWNDIDFMDRSNDFTYDKVNFKELPEFIDELHQEGMHYVVMFDPGVSNTEKASTYPPYDDGIESDIFIKNNTDGIFIGKVWNPNTTVFPDFTHPNATSYWVKQFQKFHDVLKFDGAWIDMNEISNFHYNGTVNGCPKASALENPQYLPGGLYPLYTQTLCMTAKHYNTTHYNEHNVYGIREAVATNLAMKTITGKRPFVISRSTFVGQGQFSGHWSGDIASSWEDMRYSVINMLNFNLYGIPLIGSDICGFRLSTTPELCARWFALGAFYPFARNHNDINRVDQDPAALGVNVLQSAKQNLFLRYSLLPYLYTLFYRSHAFGETAVRPLFFEFPDDVQTYPIQEQFMWGPGLLIMPALYEGMTEVIVYFPQGIWYDFYTGEKRITKEEKITLTAPLDTINVAIRDGNIIAMQYPNTTTAKSRLNTFVLIVAGGNDSFGELFWDDGESIDTYENKEYNLIKFELHDNTLKSDVLMDGYNTTMVLSSFRFLGHEQPPSNVTINDEHFDFIWDVKYKVLKIETELSLLQPFSVTLS